MNRRVDQAKTFLLTTEMPLVEIALVVGFGSQAHFSTTFRRLTGETPARWRSASKSEMMLAKRLR